MRRLPIYFIVDVSGNLDTEGSISLIEQSIKDMKSDPYLLETATITIFTFSSDVKIELEYIDLFEFQDIMFEMRPCITINEESINNVFNVLQNIHKNNFQRTSPEKKGDNRPILIWVSNLNNCLDKNNILLLGYQTMYKAAIGFSTLTQKNLLLEACTMKQWVIDKSKHLFIDFRNICLEDKIVQTENSIHFLCSGYKIIYDNKEEI